MPDATDKSHYTRKRGEMSQGAVIAWQRPLGTEVVQPVIHNGYYWLAEPRGNFERYHRLLCERLQQYLQSFGARDQRPTDKPFFRDTYARIDELERILMPTQPKSRRDNKGKGDFGKFLQRPLTDVELADCIDRKVKPTEVFNRMLAIVGDGYKVSLTVPRDGGGLASWTDISDNRPSSGYTMSTWGEDPYEALVLSIYKHVEILQGNWGELVGKSQGKRRG